MAISYLFRSIVFRHPISLFRDIKSSQTVFRPFEIASFAAMYICTAMRDCRMSNSILLSIKNQIKRAQRVILMICTSAGLWLLPRLLAWPLLYTRVL